MAIDRPVQTSDQMGAASIHPATQTRPIQVMAIASGKGGVGKTNISANLAVALALRQREVMLFDADLGLANIAVLLGLRPEMDLSHVVNGECDLDTIIIDGPARLQVLPAASGDKAMAELDPVTQTAIIRSFGDLARPPDVLVVDTATGLSDGVIRFTQAAQRLIVVVCNEPTSISDAYALIKILRSDYGIHRFHVVTNMTQTPRVGEKLFNKMLKMTERLLDVYLDHLGDVPYDKWLKRAVSEQRAVVEAYPNSSSAIAFRDIARKIDRWPAANAQGNIQFFFERLLAQESGSKRSVL